MENIVVKNAYADYSDSAKYIYSKMFKLGIELSGDRARLGYVYVSGGHYYSDNPCSLSGDIIKLSFMASHANSATNSNEILSISDSLSMRRIRILCFPNDNVVKDVTKVEFTDSTGTVYVQTLADATVNTSIAFYCVEINTLTNSIVGKLIVLDNVFDTTDTTQGQIEEGSSGTIFSDSGNGIFIGKTINEDTEEYTDEDISQRARLCLCRIEIDGEDVAVIEANTDVQKPYDWTQKNSFTTGAAVHRVDVDPIYGSLSTLKTSNTIV